MTETVTFLLFSCFVSASFTYPVVLFWCCKLAVKCLSSKREKNLFLNFICNGALRIFKL